jgi:hypothetical protein
MGNTFYDDPFPVKPADADGEPNEEWVDASANDEQAEIAYDEGVTDRWDADGYEDA